MQYIIKVFPSFYCGKIHITFIVLNTLSGQFSGIKYIRIVVQPSPPSSPELYSFCKTETVSIKH